MATYHRDRVPELEPGTTRIAFLARERLIESAETAYARSWGIRPLPKEAGLAARGAHLADASTARLEAYYGVVPA